MMNSSERRHSFAVIGAGMAGPLAAILLARRGCEVTLYERRSINGCIGHRNEGRSFNLTLTQRGLAAFRKVGLESKVLAISQPLYRRVTHIASRSPNIEAYGDHPEQALYSVRRSELNQLLLQVAAIEPGVILRDGTEFVDFQSDSRRLVLRDRDREEVYSEYPDYLLGADGINSRVREVLHRGKPADLARHYFSWAYKEFCIQESEAKCLGLPRDSLHVWPTRNALIVAVPNCDGSLTGDLLLPRGSGIEGECSSVEWDQLIQTQFVELAPHVADLCGDVLASRPTGFLQTLSTNVWTDSNRVLLIGDAAHGVFPFYGQGMNSALEDCVILDSILDQTGGNVPKAFARFASERKVDTDALCELSREHFLELQRGPAMGLLSLFLRGGDRVYSLVAHTTRPYREALREWQRQERLGKMLNWVTVPTLTLLVAAVLFHESLAHLISEIPASARVVEVRNDR